MNLDLNEKVMRAQVGQFMTAFNAMDTFELAVKLMLEESKEILEAYAHLLKEYTDLIYVTLGASIALERRETTEDVHNLSQDDKDAILNGVKLCDQLSWMFPAQMQVAAFNAVHESNMSKLGDDGKPIYREDGKVLKGPNYQPPDMVKLVSEYFNQKE